MTKPKTKGASEPKAAPSDKFRSPPVWDPIRRTHVVLTHAGPVVLVAPAVRVET